MFWQNVYPQLCHLLSFKISTVVTKSTFANNFSLKNGAAPDLFLGHIFHAVCRAHHWKWVTSAHVRAVEFLFPANILCHFKVSSGLEHDCTFIGSSEEFSAEFADKPLIHLWRSWQTCQKQAQGQRPNFIQACIWTAVYPPNTVNTRKQAGFYNYLYAQNKTPFTNWKQYFFSSFLGCHLKLKTEKTLVSEILTINSPNNDLHYVTKAQWILEFPFVQIHPSIGFLIKNHLVWQDQAFPNVH